MAAKDLYLFSAHLSNVEDIIHMKYPKFRLILIFSSDTYPFIHYALLARENAICQRRDLNFPPFTGPSLAAPPSGTGDIMSRSFTF